MTAGCARRASNRGWLGARALILLLAVAPPAAAADCGNDGAGFNAWLARFKRNYRIGWRRRATRLCCWR